MKILKKVTIFLLLLITVVNVCFIYGEVFNCKDMYKHNTSCDKDKIAACQDWDSFQGCVVQCTGGTSIECDP